MTATEPKLLWHSNSPWASTGYGNQTALMALRLKEHYDLAISAFYGLEGNVIPWNGIPVMPGLGQTHGNETILDHAKALWGDDLRKGLVLTLMDVWVLNPDIWRQFNTCSWVPVDHEPCPDPVREFLDRSACIPIAMSKFGKEQLADLDPLYVPHAIDTKVYKPIPQDEAREATAMPKDAFIVGMVAANKGNPSRKCFAESFQAFKELHRKHPDAMLYLHTELTGRFQGVNLVPLLRSLEIPEKAVIAADQYRATHMPFPAETMANIFSSLDVLLSPSAGEGFGIPVVESQSCGVPVIVSDFSAQPELCGAGWLVEGTKVYTPIGSWQVRPDVADIADALRQAYGKTTAAKKAAAKKARAFALGYDIETVMTEHMLPALKTAAKRFEDRQPVELKAAA